MIGTLTPRLVQRQVFFPGRKPGGHEMKAAPAQSVLSPDRAESEGKKMIPLGFRANNQEPSNFLLISVWNPVFS
jgi:hypothetical protein